LLPCDSLYAAAACPPVYTWIHDPPLKLLSMANKWATNGRLYMNTWKDGTANGLQGHMTAKTKPTILIRGQTNMIIFFSVLKYT
jgi:hypothetical protein